MVSCFDTQHCWQSWQRNFNPPYSHSKDDSTVRLLGETGKQRLHALKVGLKLHPLHLWSIGLCPQCWYKVYISTVGTRPWRRRTLARSKLACFNVQTCTENGKSWPHGLETFVSSLNGPILIKYIYNMFTCFFSKLHPRYSVYCFCQADFWPGLKHVMHRLDEAWNVSVFVAASLT